MAVRENPVKQKLASGGTTYGTMIFEFLSPGLPQMSVNAGAEFLFYDMEHSGFEIADMKDQFALCRGLGLVPLVRPPGKQYQYVARLLDIGAMGFLFQMVESAEEAAELVSGLATRPAATAARFLAAPMTITTAPRSPTLSLTWKRAR